MLSLMQAMYMLGDWGYLLAVAAAFGCSAAFFAWIDRRNRRGSKDGKSRDSGHSGAGFAILFLMASVVLSALFAAGWATALR